MACAHCIGFASLARQEPRRHHRVMPVIGDGTAQAIHSFAVAHAWLTPVVVVVETAHKAGHHRHVGAADAGHESEDLGDTHHAGLPEFQGIGRLRDIQERTTR